MPSRLNKKGFDASNAPLGAEYLQSATKSPRGDEETGPGKNATNLLTIIWPFTNGEMLWFWYRIIE